MNYLKIFDLYPKILTIRKTAFSTYYMNKLSLALSVIIIIFVIITIAGIISTYDQKNKNLYQDLKVLGDDNIPEIKILMNEININQTKTDNNERINKGIISFGFINKITNKHVPIDITKFIIEIANKEIKEGDNVLNYLNKYLSIVDERFNKTKSDLKDNDKSDIYKKIISYKKCTFFSRKDINNNIRDTYCIENELFFSKFQDVELNIKKCKNDTYMAISSNHLNFEEMYLKPLLNKNNKLVLKNCTRHDDLMCQIATKYILYLIDYVYNKELDSLTLESKIMNFILNAKQILDKEIKIIHRDENENSANNTTMINLHLDILNEYNAMDINSVRSAILNKSYYDKSIIREHAIEMKIGAIYNLVNDMIESIIDKSNEDIMKKAIVNKTELSSFTNPFSTDSIQDLYVKLELQDNIGYIRNQVKCSSEEEINKFIEEHLLVIYTSFDELNSFDINKNFNSEEFNLSSKNKLFAQKNLNLNYISYFSSGFNLILQNHEKFSFVNDRPFEVIEEKYNPEDRNFFQMRILIGKSYYEYFDVSLDYILILFIILSLFVLSIFFMKCIFGSYFDFVFRMEKVNSIYTFKPTNEKSFEKFVTVKYFELMMNNKMLKNDKNLQNFNLDNEKQNENTNHQDSKLIDKSNKNNQETNNQSKYNSNYDLKDKNENRENTLISHYDLTTILLNEIFNMETLEFLYKEVQITSKNITVYQLNENQKISIFKKIAMDYENRKRKFKIVKYNNLKIIFNIINNISKQEISFTFLQYKIYQLKSICCCICNLFINSKIEKEIQLFESLKFDKELDISNIINSYNIIDQVEKNIFDSGTSKILNNLPNKLLDLTKFNDINDQQIDLIFINSREKLFESILNDEEKSNEEKLDEIRILVNKILQILTKLSDAKRYEELDIPLLKKIGYDDSTLSTILAEKIRYKKIMKNSSFKNEKYAGILQTTDKKVIHNELDISIKSKIDVSNANEDLKFNMMDIIVKVDKKSKKKQKKEAEKSIDDIFYKL